MRTPIAITLVASLAWLASGCTASDLSADAGVTVTGRVDSPDGGPLPSANLVLIKEPDLGEAIGGVFEVVTTLGIACLASNAPTICEQGFKQTSTAAGSYSFALTGAQTQGSVDDADTFDLATQSATPTGALAGPSSSEQFLINTPTLALPDLRLWDPAVMFSTTTTTASATFDALPTAYGSAPATGIAFTTGASAVVWSQPATTGETFDARLLEDAQGSLVATATAAGDATQTSVTFTYQSAAVAFAGVAGAAPSRGSACFEQGATGAVALTPCTLTDGDFGTAAPLQSCATSSCSGQTLNNWAYVDLGTARSFSLVVVRGSVSDAVVESSLDANAWAAVSATPQSDVFAVTGTGMARYVRVRASSATATVAGLTEISVW